jgi:hypothetical protein
MILVIRGQKVMLDKDLAELYGVKSIALRQQVKRNQERFPEDFMFQLTSNEARALVSQNVIPSARNFGGYLPYVFTEQGVAMLSSVLHSKRAIQVNIEIMRAFTQLRRMFLTNVDLRRKIAEMERTYEAPRLKPWYLCMTLLRQSAFVLLRRTSPLASQGSSAFSR